MTCLLNWVGLNGLCSLNLCKSVSCVCLYIVFLQAEAVKLTWKRNRLDRHPGIPWGNFKVLSGFSRLRLGDEGLSRTSGKLPPLWELSNILYCIGTHTVESRYHELDGTSRIFCCSANFVVAKLTNNGTWWHMKKLQHHTFLNRVLQTGWDTTIFGDICFLSHRY